MFTTLLRILLVVSLGVCSGCMTLTSTAQGRATFSLPQANLMTPARTLVPLISWTQWSATSKSLTKTPNSSTTSKKISPSQ